jgi:polar amino acid transport system substrate-binding protein
LPTSIKTYENLVRQGHPIEKAMPMTGQVYGIACNRQTPPHLVQRLQAELDKLIASGGQDRTFVAYGLPPNTHTMEGGEKK